MTDICTKFPSNLSSSKSPKNNPGTINVCNTCRGNPPNREFGRMSKLCVDISLRLACVYFLFLQEGKDKEFLIANLQAVYERSGLVPPHRGSDPSHRWKLFVAATQLRCLPTFEWPRFSNLERLFCVNTILHVMRFPLNFSPQSVAEQHSQQRL